MVKNMAIVSKGVKNILRTEVFDRLNGHFAVYKPADVLPGQVASRVKHALLRDLNELPDPYPESVVKIVPDEARLDHNPNALTALSVPSLAGHPLVKGRKYKSLRLRLLSEGHDLKSSGVMALALQEGVERVDFYKQARLPSQYIIHGRLGFATFSHDIEGTIVEKSTYGHVTQPKIEKVLSGLLRMSQKDIIRHSGVNIQSQEAYELASRNLLQPSGDIPCLLLDLRCSKFEPPDFEIEVHCLRESAQYLRKVINDVGLFLKTNAVSIKVRKIQEGPFSLDNCLLRKDWRLDPILDALRTCNPLMSTYKLLPIELQKDELLAKRLVKDNISKDITQEEERCFVHRAESAPLKE
ncbi:pseudouridylate synthase TRUB2, mitochondrial-like [Apostichopus japonicus]|uniref:pseudouridylate synthase TRUB2, mitochondrial-like n=1 Tax=Stichopus japonicus TaxID=307972 RepID=UPI003AB8074F